MDLKVFHIALFVFSTEMASADVAKIEDGLKALAEEIPELRFFHYGFDLGLVSGNADLVVVAGFDNNDAYLLYANHPKHVEFVRTVMRPHLAKRSAIQVSRPASWLG